jgi:hypothetical protein
MVKYTKKDKIFIKEFGLMLSFFVCDENKIYEIFN